MANVPILYPLKIPENQRFSGVFRGRNGNIGQKWVNISKIKVRKHFKCFLSVFLILLFIIKRFVTSFMKFSKSDFSSTVLFYIVLKRWRKIEWVLCKGSNSYHTTPRFYLALKQSKFWMFEWQIFIYRLIILLTQFTRTH